MLSLAGDKSSTDILFMSTVSKEQQGYEQICPAVNISHISIDSTIFRVGKSFLEANEPIVPDLCPSPEAQFCPLAHLQPEFLRRAVV
jgi:hypothetical protein